MRRINAFEKFRRFLRGHHRGRALEDGVPWPTDGMRRVRCDDLALTSQSNNMRIQARCCLTVGALRVACN
jgi:hypothetical protein